MWPRAECWPNVMKFSNRSKHMKIVAENFSQKHVIFNFAVITLNSH